MLHVVYRAAAARGKGARVNHDKASEACRNAAQAARAYREASLRNAELMRKLAGNWVTERARTDVATMYLKQAQRYESIATAYSGLEQGANALAGAIRRAGKEEDAAMT